MIYAKSGDLVLGGPDDQDVISIKWFRAGGRSSGGRPDTAVQSSPSSSTVVGFGHFEELVGVNGGFYQPSVDDLNCRIIVECSSKVATDENTSMRDHGCVRQSMCESQCLTLIGVAWQNHHSMQTNPA